MLVRRLLIAYLVYYRALAMLQRPGALCGPHGALSHLQQHDSGTRGDGADGACACCTNSRADLAQGVSGVGIGAHSGAGRRLLAVWRDRRRLRTPEGGAIPRRAKRWGSNLRVDVA